MATRRRTALSVGTAKEREHARSVIPARPPFYTGQDLARFCEVDLKTVHHWAERGKVLHRRTEGRHLRFRRNDIIRFLRTHGYPLPTELSRVRCLVALALPVDTTERAAEKPSLPDGPPSDVPTSDFVTKLAIRFDVRQFSTGIAGLTHVLATEPDVLVLSLDDATIAGARSIAALKADAATTWLAVAAIGEGEALEAARSAGADVVLARRDIARLGVELARHLAVTS